MNQIEFNFNQSQVSTKQKDQLKFQLLEEIKNIKKATEKGYDDDHASINLPKDNNALQQVLQVIEEKNRLNPTYVVVVGIGGSNLGTLAVFEAIYGKKHNLKTNQKKILFADTVDSDLLNDIKRIIEPVLKNNEQIILNVVSKSGSTTETIANFEVLLNLLERYKSDYRENVVVTTDYDSKLWHLAKKKQYSVLEIPKKVGGRYSVFSPVGLFPLGLIGIDIAQLLEGAKEMIHRCLVEDIEQNPAASAAACSYFHFKQGKNIHDLFLFSDDLESIGKWYRQLLAESVGKEHDLHHNQVFTGITPTYSIGSTDLHSMAQLYLGGPFDKFTTFVHVKHNKQAVILPNYVEYASLVEGIQNKPMREIMNAIYEGVKTAFSNNKRPFIEVELPDKSEVSIGQFLQYKMMETMMIGALLEVNPFDQPNVEAYKKETRKILKGENIG
jgi:glucose-6-phosphate isomerase